MYKYSKEPFPLVFIFIEEKIMHMPKTNKHKLYIKKKKSERVYTPLSVYLLPNACLKICDNTLSST